MKKWPRTTASKERINARHGRNCDTWQHLKDFCCAAELDWKTAAKHASSQVPLSWSWRVFELQTYLDMPSLSNSNSKGLFSHRLKQLVHTLHKLVWEYRDRVFVARLKTLTEPSAKFFGERHFWLLNSCHLRWFKHHPLKAGKRTRCSTVFSQLSHQRRLLQDLRTKVFYLCSYIQHHFSHIFPGLQQVGIFRPH